jgi:hypothetical protein
MDIDDTTFLLRLPKSLKTMYQALCESRDVTVSSTLRDFMANEVAQSVLSDRTVRKPNKTPSSDLKTNQTSKDAPTVNKADTVQNKAVASAINAANRRNKKKRKK